MQKRNSFDEFLLMIIAFLLVSAMMFIIFSTYLEMYTKQKKVEEGKTLVQDCIERLSSYCKGKKEKGQLKSSICPLLSSSTYLWGTYECANGLQKAFFSTESFSVEYSKGELRYVSDVAF